MPRQYIFDSNTLLTGCVKQKFADRGQRTTFARRHLSTFLNYPSFPEDSNSRLDVLNSIEQKMISMVPVSKRTFIRYVVCAAVLCVSLIMSNAMYAQYVETPRQNVAINGQINGFWEYLPSGYTANPTKTYPLLVFLHGWGEIGTGNLPSMSAVLIHGVPRVIEWNIFPQSVSYNGQSFSFIVLS